MTNNRWDKLAPFELGDVWSHALILWCAIRWSCSSLVVRRQLVSCDEFGNPSLTNCCSAVITPANQDAAGSNNWLNTNSTKEKIMSFHSLCCQDCSHNLSTLIVFFEQNTAFVLTQCGRNWQECPHGPWDCWKQRFAVKGNAVCLQPKAQLHGRIASMKIQTQKMPCIQNQAAAAQKQLMSCLDHWKMQSNAATSADVCHAWLNRVTNWCIISSGVNKIHWCWKQQWSFAFDDKPLCTELFAFVLHQWTMGIFPSFLGVFTLNVCCSVCESCLAVGCDWIFVPNPIVAHHSMVHIVSRRE